MNRRDSWWPMVMPVALAFLCILLLTSLLIVGFGRKLDFDSRKGSERLAATLVHAALRNLRRLAADYGWWNDAYQNLVVAPDSAWADWNFGVHLHSWHDVDVCAVLAADGSFVFVYVQGQRGTSSWHGGEDGQRMGLGADVLFATAQASSLERAEPASGLVRAGGTVYLAAVTPVMPETEPPGTVRAPRSLLVVYRALSGPLLAELAADYDLPGLAMVPADLPGDVPAEIPHLSLVTADGAIVGALVWSPSRPSDSLYGLVWPLFGITLLFAFALLTLFLLRADRLLRRHAELSTALEGHRQLIELNAELMATARHEVRNPLATIAAAADLLDTYGDRMSPAERKQETQAIATATRVMSKLFTDTFAAPAGLPRPFRRSPPRPIMVADFCRELWAALSRRRPMHHRLEVSEPMGPTEVFADEMLLGSVIGNLLDNATKYSPDSDTVTVKIWTEGDEICVDVRDFGIGIAVADIQDIYEPFLRLDEGGAIDGMGIGLTVVRTALIRLGGTICVESWIGGGSLFRVRLPKGPPVTRERKA